MVTLHITSFNIQICLYFAHQISEQTVPTSLHSLKQQPKIISKQNNYPEHFLYL